MSEVQSRPSRGRTTARGGRGGGHGSRGPRSSNKQTNGDHFASSTGDGTADQGELGELKKRYSSQLSTLKELFPDWADVDLVLALEESDGDLPGTIEKITEGTVSQFSEVKKTKDRSRSKAKEPTSITADAGSTSTRGTRGRGGEGSIRGGRGRTERGRGGFRGARGGAQATANGARANGPTSIPTTEAGIWDTAPAGENKENASWDQPATTQPAEQEVAKSTAAPEPTGPAKKTWASMFAKPKAAPAPPKPVTQPKSAAEEETAPIPSETPAHEVAPEEVVAQEELPIPPVADEVTEPPAIVEDLAHLTPPQKPQEEPAADLTPSKDELTTDNVEHLPDVSHPPATETAASTVASSRDIGSAAGIATPLGNIHQPPIGRPGLGGFATTALKATATPRSVSFQRRLAEQQEAVVMPGNHAVDRAAVQFGSLGLNGDLDADALDVDEDREEAETRTQPPQHSPVAQPRAALPPAPRQAPPAAESQVQESLPTPKPAPGLPAPQQQQQPAAQPSPPSSIGAQAAQQQQAQGNQYNQFARYGQSEQSAPAQKPYDPFGQQVPQTSQFDSYSSQTQNQNQAQQGQSQAGAFSSAPDNYGSQYFTSDQQRNAYQNFYQNYNQPNAASQQEAGSTQQRTGSAFGAAPNESSFPQSQAQQAPSRYNDAQNSGHNTPNPPLGGQHPSGPTSQQAQHMPQPHGQPGHAGGYPGYNHPYYGGSPYYNYMSQFNSYGQQGYGGFGGKGMYGQPHHGYGMSPQTSFDQHSSSPANVGSFGRESGLSGGLGDYGRSGSTQPSSQHNASAAGGYGGFPDMLGRSQAGGFPNQSSYGQQQGQQTGGDDSLKPFGESKSGSGPSPSALGQPGRPGSATNNTPGQSGQSGLPPPQSHQGFGGYPSHLNQLQGGQGNQYGGLGGLGHQGGSHQSGYGGGYGGFGGGYGGSYNRGGWGTNYGQH